MFTMMNGARLLVGNEGIALADIAYQTALAFAKDRRQSRALDPDKREKDQPADNILVHPDVRRMLLNVKSTVEGMRGLATWVSTLIDLAHHHPDEKAREEADDLVALLTPVVKGYCTERGFLNVSEAMQVCGGAGYTVDWSIEQYLRDVRIGMIYEGTNHIQALDLVGRKLPRNGGRSFQLFCKRVQELIESAKDERVAPFAKELGSALGTLVKVTTEMGGKAMQDAEIAGAGRLQLPRALRPHRPGIFVDPSGEPRGRKRRSQRRHQDQDRTLLFRHDPSRFGRPGEDHRSRQRSHHGVQSRRALDGATRGGSPGCLG